MQNYSSRYLEQYQNSFLRRAVCAQSVWQLLWLFRCLERPGDLGEVEGKSNVHKAKMRRFMFSKMQQCMPGFVVLSLTMESANYLPVSPSITPTMPFVYFKEEEDISIIWAWYTIYLTLITEPSLCCSDNIKCINNICNIHLTSWCLRVTHGQD